MKFRVLVGPDEDGVFVAECPTLPGCISQGRTGPEALENIKDAIAGYLASLEKHGEAIPLPVNEEVVEVPAWAACRCADASLVAEDRMSGLPEPPKTEWRKR